MDNLWNLNFHVNYYREKQAERLATHLEEKKSISSFLYPDAERELDNLIEAAQRLLDELKTKENTPKKKPFWRRK